MSVYEIKLKREIWNGLLHIIVGAVVTHTFLSYLPIWLIVMILIVIGSIREYWQYKRNKIQPFYIQLIDVLTLVIGGLIWYCVVIYFHINVDIL